MTGWRIATAMLLGIGAWLGAGLAPAAADTVAERVFDRGLMAGIKAPTILRYSYERRDGVADTTERQPIVMDVRSVDEAGNKAVFFDLFAGDAGRQFGPVASSSQNPLVLVFLQRDATAMQSLTGGSQDYFRNRLRAAFKEPAETTTTTVDVGGQPMPATRLVIRPFHADPKIERFPQFKDKSYEFVVAESVPGGVYRLGTSVLGPDGRLVLKETMTFASEIRP